MTKMYKSKVYKWFGVDWITIRDSFRVREWFSHQERYTQVVVVIEAICAVIAVVAVVALFVSIIGA